jgi:hypothetical protein
MSSLSSGDAWDAPAPVPPLLSVLVERYGRAPRQIPPESDGVVRAMPVILRIEREPPGRTALLEAAAQAALAVCVAPEPAWQEPLRLWIDGRIRKIARRARGAHWAAVQELPGITVSVDGAQARALLPGPVDAVPKIVSRLQIGGTELPVDSPGPAGRACGRDRGPRRGLHRGGPGHRDLPRRLRRGAAARSAHDHRRRRGSSRRS